MTLSFSIADPAQMQHAPSSISPPPTTPYPPLSPLSPISPLLLSRYADDLATRAKHGFVQYQRQALIGGAYGLTASAESHPQSALGVDEAVLLRPGYWVNFLWKRVLGQNVLNATSTSAAVRAYAFAGSAPSPYAAKECTATGGAFGAGAGRVGSGSKQLLLVNLSPEDTSTVKLASCSSGYHAWVLAPPPSNATDSPTSSSPPASAASSSASFVSNASSASSSSSKVDPFSKRVQMNGKLLPNRVDVDGGGAAPSSFLGTIPVDAMTGPCSIDLPPLSVAFVCYR